LRRNPKPCMEARSPEVNDFQVRKYRPSDRESVRALCCETGFLGNAIDPVFEDRELFADFLTDYYLRYEPDSAFVVTKGGTLHGYILGSRHPGKHQFHSLFQNFVYGGRIVRRYLGYRPESRRYIHWLVSKAWREVPSAPRTIGHFHINLLPAAKSVQTTRDLLETYLRHLYDHGVKQVHAQMVTFDGRRGTKLFERYGFKVLNQSEITKYRRFTDQTVYLCTIVKNLEKQGDRLLYPVRQSADVE
jgi:L-amino acid N-acyltransferase YncA